MEITIINVYLDLGAGRRGTDMGPSAIHVAGLTTRLTAMGHSVCEVKELRPPSFEQPGQGAANARFLTVIESVAVELADVVEEVLDQGRFPLVLGGDHSIAIGTVSGLARAQRRKGERLGLIWIDAHTDMNTPQSTSSGNIHGMPLAVLLGYGPDSLTMIAGGSAVEARDVVIIGARSIDPKERELVKSSGVGLYTMSDIDRQGLSHVVTEAIERVSDGTAGFHLSFDLDGVDPEVAPGVGTPVMGGLSLRESHLICEQVSATGRLLGMEVVELNPILDRENRTGRLAVWLIQSSLGQTII